jgi:hypothetical protein
MATRTVAVTLKQKAGTTDHNSVDLTIKNISVVIRSTSTDKIKWSAKGADVTIALKPGAANPFAGLALPLHIPAGTTTGTYQNLNNANETIYGYSMTITPNPPILFPHAGPMGTIVIDPEVVVDDTPPPGGGHGKKNVARKHGGGKKKAARKRGGGRGGRSRAASRRKLSGGRGSRRPSARRARKR